MQSIQDRLQTAASFPDLLAASFDAFEAIRQEASRWVDGVPELFAAFMTTADAAVDGREAVTAAPSLPCGPADPQFSLLPANATLNEATGTLADLGTFLGRCLTRAATTANNPEDRAACQKAADAARRVHHLMTCGDNASGLR